MQHEYKPSIPARHPQQTRGAGPATRAEGASRTAKNGTFTPAAPLLARADPGRSSSAVVGRIRRCQPKWILEPGWGHGDLSKHRGWGGAWSQYHVHHQCDQRKAVPNACKARRSPPPGMLLWLRRGKRQIKQLSAVNLRSRPMALKHCR